MNRFCNTVLPLLLLAVPGPARAETPGEKVLRKMDEGMTKARDQHFVHKMVTKEPGKAKRVIKMDVHIKGKEWRHVKMLEPGDIKGMKILTLSLNKMYVYLPAYRKVRRVAGHAKEQGFMGTTFSQDEISIVTYSPTFKGKLLKETKTHWIVKATRRPGKEFRHKTLVFKIRKDLAMFDELKYYSEKGELMKTETRKDYDCKEGICQPKTIRLVDHTSHM